MHNTATTSGAALGMYVSANSVTSGSYDVRNNIFSNTWPGSNKYAFYSAAGAAVYSQLNYNLYWAPTGNVGFITGGARTTFANWQTATGKETNGKTGDPLFNSPTIPAPTTGSPALASGTPVSGVTTDIIGVTRSGSTPSIGAYELPGDFAPPVITYTVLTNTCIAGNRELIATINDVTGVNTSNTLRPRMYYRKNSNPYVSTQGVKTGGTSQSGTWKFTLNTAPLGGLVAGDVISYYIVAQDSSVNNNLGSGPTGVDGADVNTITTNPTPNTFTIQTPLNPGTYTVGTGGNYTTLTAALSAFGTSCLSGPVVFTLLNASYSAATGETMPLVIPKKSVDNPGYTLTIKPAAGVNATITGTATFAMIFDGADYITIDGSNNGTTSRNLTITNSSVATSTGALRFNSYGAADGCKSDVIKNCNISAGTKGTGASAATIVTTWGMYFGDNLGNATGLDHDYITIENNLFTKVAIAIQAGASTAGVLNNWTIKNNTIGDAASAANSIGRTGLSINNADALSVTGNTFTNINVADNGGAAGIILGTNVNNSTIGKNIITGIRQSNPVPAPFGARGIDIAAGTGSSNITVHNNAISDVIGGGASTGIGEIVAGIRMTGTASGIKLYYNTVHLGAGSYSGNSGGTVSAALYVGTGAASLDIRNNIFSTTISNSATSAARTYGIYSDAASGAFTTMNYNAYSALAPGSQGVAGFIGSARTTLAAIISGFGGNTNSTVGIPVFTSPTDLHPASTGNCGFDNRAVAIGGYSTDLDNVNRSTTPDLGAYEFTNTGDNQWVGTVSNNWQTPGNWCSNTVPTATSDVTINAGTPFPPKLTNQAFARNLTVNAGAVVTLSDFGLTVSGTLTGTGVFAGTFNSKLTFSGTGTIGTLNMKSDSSSLNMLSLTGTGSTITLGTATGITNKLDIGANTLNSGGFLAIKVKHKRYRKCRSDDRYYQRYCHS